ncbi:Ger(x)C family spore germination protein [Oceanirhabdus seepicola]|uniref:Ger(X)C family spore germination protein n=1 Tax=Oceanirhabdus seepicola TaxID=2828781 RepID=A0A9J6P5M2_9CLOT|nr:Ger(x)C family spore germination protein [Oceanirhabdus seepicola]MCM1991422.1 Ger(x)C family spore germination protein [Oceanirhabdus seepicola]
MNKIKATSLITIFILISFLLTSCWSYKEVNDVDIVMGAGIDWDNFKNEYIITFELFSSSIGEKGEKTAKLLQHKGKTLFKAIRNIVEKNGKPAYWPHTKVIIIGKDMAEHGIIPLIDYTMRDAEFRPDMKILVSDESTAEDIFLKKNDSKEIISTKLEESLNYQGKVGTYKRVFFWDLTQKMYQEGYESIIPLVYNDNTDKSSITRISGLAVFKKDKLIGTLNNHEAMYYLFIDNDITNQAFVVEQEVDDETFNICLEILKSKTKITPIKKDNNITIKIDIKTEFSIVEIDGTIDVIKENARKKLERHTEKKIEENIKDLISKVQTNYNSDIFGFGNSIKKDMPYEWEKIGKDWDKNFPNLDVEVNSHVKITKSSLLSKPHKIAE